MEKLKVKHDHKLTDILKVGIFAIFLLLPMLMFLPSCAYYGVNKYAEPSTKQVENYQVVDFNQSMKRLQNNNYVAVANTETLNFIDNSAIFFVSNSYGGFRTNYQIELITNHKYYLSFEYKIDSAITGGLMYSDSNGQIGFTVDNLSNTNYLKAEILKTNTIAETTYIYIWNTQNEQINYYVRNLQLIDLTQIFGSGNEPTIAEFNEMFPNDYYDYTESKKIEIPDGTYSTRLTITDEIEYQWQNLWTLPVLNWVNENNFTFTINMFTSIFGISQRSFLTSYLTYILVMTAIYVIFDIVLSMFKLVTHLFNSKE